MIIFYFEQKFILRLWNYIKYNLIWIVIVYLIFSIGSGEPNPIHWDIIGEKYIFCLYIIYIIVPPFFRTKKYIEKIGIFTVRQNIYYNYKYF